MTSTFPASSSSLLRFERRFAVQRSKDEELAGNVLVVTLLGELVGQVEQLAEIVAEVHVAAGTFDFRQAIARLAELRTHQIDVNAGLGQQTADRATLLIEQRNHQMDGFDELVVLADRQGLRIAQCHLEFTREFVHSHGAFPKFETAL